MRRFFCYFLILLTIGIRVCNFINFAKVGSSCILHIYAHMCIYRIFKWQVFQNLSFLFLKAFISPMFCVEFEVKKVKLLRSLYYKSLIVFFCKIKLLFFYEGFFRPLNHIFVDIFFLCMLHLFLTERSTYDCNIFSIILSL